MKKSDIALIILISGICILISYLITSKLMGKPAEKTDKIPYLETISEGLAEVDIETFNPYAINPVLDTYAGSTCKVGYVWDNEVFACVEEKSNVDNSVDENDENKDNQNNNED